MSIFSALEPIIARKRSAWKVAPLRRIATLIEEADASGAASLLSLTSAGQLTTRSGDRQPPADEYRLRYRLVRPGDLVVNPMWLPGGAVGVTDRTGAVSPEYRIYRFGSNVHPRYIHHLLRSLPYSDQYRLLVRAETTFDRRITKEDFWELPVLMPSPEAQRTIAFFLDAETSRVDALITRKRRMIELLQERWQVLVELRMRALAEAHGSIPLKRVVRCLDGRRVPVSAVDRADRKGPFPYYGASGVVDWIDDYLFDEVLVLLGEDGAQLGDPTYPIAQVVSGKVWVNNHAHVLRPTAADPSFLALHLNTFDRMDVISGGTREKITQGDMDRIPVPHIPPDHQREIAEGLRQGRSRDSSLIERLTRQIDLLAEHRQALITAAVTGEINIPGAAA